MVTPQELNMLCGKSNEINGEQNCFDFDRCEKNCLLLTRSEKNCMFKLGVEKKSLIMKEKHSPPRVKWSAPNICCLYDMSCCYLHNSVLITWQIVTLLL